MVRVDGNCSLWTSGEPQVGYSCCGVQGALWANSETFKKCKSDLSFMRLVGGVPKGGLLWRTGRMLSFYGNRYTWLLLLSWLAGVEKVWLVFGGLACLGKVAPVHANISSLKQMHLNGLAFEAFLLFGLGIRVSTLKLCDGSQRRVCARPLLSSMWTAVVSCA